MYLIRLYISAECNGNFQDFQAPLNCSQITKQCNITFTLNSQFISFKSQMEIHDLNQKLLGYYSTKGFDMFRYLYYQNGNQYTGATIERALFSSAYFISRCNSNYNYQFIWNSDILKERFIIYKNGMLLGESLKDQFISCKPSVTVMTSGENGTVIAELNRSCGESFFSDVWKVVNYRPDLMENYALGALAYITTLNE
jgi:hypothetical protein